VLKDNDGTPFTFTRLNGLGIDPAERYLYLSLYTEAPSKTYWHYYRVCRYNLKNGEFTVLNKTLITYTAASDSLLMYSLRREIGDVKIFTATGIYPDSIGNVYLTWISRMVTHLDDGGNYTYIFKIHLLLITLHP